MHIVSKECGTITCAHFLCIQHNNTLFCKEMLLETSKKQTGDKTGG